jgi:hypothetical protein
VLKKFNLAPLAQVEKISSTFTAFSRPFRISRRENKKHGGSIMNCTADNSINRHYSIRSFALALLLGALALTALATPHVAAQPTGVRNSSGPRRLNEKQLQQVQESLRRKSGFVELGFDEQGALTLGNRQHIRGGSATARALLIAALDSPNLYELESHERSPEVAFARIDESEDRLIGETGQRLTI